MADTKLTGLTADTSPALTDLTYGVKNPGGTPLSRKLTWQTVYGLINSLSTDATPDMAADYVPTYDASASAAKKVLAGVLVSDVNIALTDITTNNSGTSKHGFLPKIPNSYLYDLSGKDGTWVIRRIYKSSIETINTNGVPQNDDALVIPVTANEILEFEIMLYITAANTTMDFKCGFTVPASCTMLWGAVGGESTQIGNNFAPVQVASTPVGLLSESGTMSLATFAGTIGLKLAGKINVGATAGNVQFQWSQNTSNGSNLSVLADSNIKYLKFA